MLVNARVKVALYVPDKTCIAQVTLDKINNALLGVAWAHTGLDLV